MRKLRQAAAALVVPQRGLKLLAGVLVAAILLADWQIIAAERRAAIRDYTTATTNLANGMFAQTARSLELVDTALRDIQRAATDDPAPERIGENLRGRKLFDLMVAEGRRLDMILSLAVLDADGQLANSTSGWPRHPRDLSDAEFFRHFQVTDDPAPLIGLPRREPSTGFWTTAFARQIRDRQGRFAGVVYARLSLSALEDFYRTAMPPQRTVMLVRRDGLMLLRYPDAAGATGQRIPPNLPWHAAVAAGGGVLRSPISAEGPPILAVVRPHPTLPFVVTATVAESLVLSEWYHQRIWLILGGVLASAVAVLLIRLFALQIGRLDLRNRELDDARRQLDAALTNMSQGLSFFGGDSRLIVCNRRFGEIYGLSAAALRPGTPLATLADCCDAAGETARARLHGLAAIARAGTPHQDAIELADGRTIAIQLQPMTDGGWVATHEDISQRREAETRIAFLARHDALTGLPNRTVLLERIGQALVRAARSAGFAVLFLDLDRFKAVNDTLGHAAGDALLRMVAARLRAVVREEDTVARLGGDEFVVLQAGLPVPEHAAVLAERIIASVGAPYRIAGHEVFVGVSIGIDTAVSSRKEAEVLLRNADMALYVAKTEGRGQFRFFASAMDEAAQNRHALERDLRQAMARGELALLYQPIVSAASGKACGFEALLRWRHPARGVLRPRDFMAVAEDSGLIIPIGEWVIAEACRAAARWPEGLCIAVNLSAAQFRDANLAAAVRAATAGAGLAAHRLELEVTEAALLKGQDRNIDVLRDLRAGGAGIVLDNFGAGASSLSTLRGFPFARIKIDRSFIDDLTQRREALFVIRAIVGLCGNLGIPTTAQGLRDAEQLALLLAEGCAAFQGEMFGEPQPDGRLGSLIGARLLRRDPREGDEPGRADAALLANPLLDR